MVAIIKPTMLMLMVILRQQRVIVSAETSGRILKIDPTEGTEIEKGAEIALIDTTLFHLQKAEIDAE